MIIQSLHIKGAIKTKSVQYIKESKHFISFCAFPSSLKSPPSSVRVKTIAFVCYKFATYAHILDSSITLQNQAPDCILW